MTGADAAKRLLANQGIYDVTVQPGRRCNLTDHYDPRTQDRKPVPRPCIRMPHPLRPSEWPPTSAATPCRMPMRDTAPLRITQRPSCRRQTLGSQSFLAPDPILGLVYSADLLSPLVEIWASLMFCSGGAVPACDTSGRVQCVCPCGKTSGCTGHSRGRGSKRDEKSTERGGTDLCGGSSDFDPAASPSHNSLWRKKQT